MNELTELQGTIGYALATLASSVALLIINKKKRNGANVWLFSTFITALLAFDVQTSFRFTIKNHLSEWATHFGLYSQRHNTQALVLICLLLLVIASTYSLRFKMNTPSEFKLMLFGLGSALFWFVLSIVSHHAIDRVIYSPIGHVYLICWLWNISAFCIISSSLITTKKLL